MFKASLTFLVIFTGVAVVPAGADPATSAAAQTELAAAIHGYQAALLHHGQAPLAAGRLGVPEDWTHHHLVFSAPKAGSAAASKVLNEPRYWQQRLARALNVAHAEDAKTQAIWRRRAKKGLWEYNLGSTGTVGTANFPAKYSFATNSADCTNDYVVYNTSAAGTANQPNIVAFNGLYLGASGCPTTLPNVLWAYNTGTGTVVTSPVLSGDGTKVAFVETAAGGATLRILKGHSAEGCFNLTAAACVTGGTTGLYVWNAHTVDVTADNTSGTQSWTSWSACTSAKSCQISISFNLSKPDTNSSPFFDYTNDVLYVGDDNGSLHKFTGIFNGTPAEVKAGGWPVTVDSGKILTSPAFDGTNIYAGDSAAQINCIVASSALKCVTGVTLTNGGTIDDGPLVDTSTQKVFWLQTEPQTTFWTVTHDLVQTDTMLGSTVTNRIRSPFFTVTNIDVMHTDAFDYSYLSGDVATGFLYFCGPKNTGTLVSNQPSLYRVGFTSSLGAMSTTFTLAVDLVSSDATEECSPITEFYNGVDQLFVGVTANGIQVPSCNTTTGCIYALKPTATTSTVSSVSTTSGSPTISVTTGGNPFMALVGHAVTGPGIPPYTTLVSTSGTGMRTGTLSQNATATGTITLTGITSTTAPSSASAGLNSAGGTSGIVIDNAAGTTGASQTYFSTLGTQVCTNGTTATSTASVGCAIQATQSSLN